MPIIRDPKQNQFESNFGILFDNGVYRAYKKENDDIKRILPAGWIVEITDVKNLATPIEWDTNVTTVVKINPVGDEDPRVKNKKILKILKKAISLGDLEPGSTPEYKIETYETL